MAIKEDYDNLTVATRRWNKDRTPSKDSQQLFTVVGCSLDSTQMDILRANLPTAVITNITKDDWDMVEAYPKDLPYPYILVVCNVFHYSREPDIWFKNCFNSCTELWVQDLLHRPRGASQQFGGDADCSRYVLGNRFTEYFQYGLPIKRLLDYWVYDAGSFREKRTMINFMARFRGEK